MGKEIWDVIVIGGGHAGCEAAVAAAKLGARTALLTMNPDRIGFMSCNPAMGGLAKGQLIKEIDALGGVMGENTDRTAIQYRRLNSSKGPAVRSSRAQCDKKLYALRMQERLRGVPGLALLGVEATEVLVEHGKVRGLKLSTGEELLTHTVVVTTGTFLAAVMHTGAEQAAGGRVGDSAAFSLSNNLKDLGFRLRRLKTGTPPRLHKRSIHFNKLDIQPGDEKPLPFSFYYRASRFPELPQVPCHISYTNENTHRIIEEAFHLSPLFTGAITGIGPRYCPSIEDKVKRFREKDRHQIFLEPEGLDTDEIYVNGISTSLPREVQERFVRSIEGLENAEFTKFGYAVEYDAVDARQLRRTLESKDVSGLFTAGQINGTSGYEEAGAQGWIAGVNAALHSKGRDPFSIGREEGYIGVLIDDLILKGSDEPYRMFTSRAEHRLLLREDNADLRLSEKAFRLGTLGEREFRILEKRREDIDLLRRDLQAFALVPGPESEHWFTQRGQPLIRDRVTGESLLRRPGITCEDLVQAGFGASFSPNRDVVEQVEIQIKYEGYIRRDEELLEGIRKSELMSVPVDLDYREVPGLSAEIQLRLSETRPETLGQASRLQGVTPAAIANLMIFLKMGSVKSQSTSPEVRR